MRGNPKKIKQIPQEFFQQVWVPQRQSFFLTITPQKYNFLHQIFNQECLQRISTNPQIKPNLHKFTEEILDGKPQNLQIFLHEMCFLYSPVC